MKPRHVVVIGAGLGGLSAAIRLAARGHRVEIFERTDAAGGKAGEVRAAGFRFDTGPSLVTMPFVVEELFRSAGERLSDHLELVPLSPLCRYFYPDGSRLDAFADAGAMEAAVRAFSPPDAGRVRAFLAYSERLYRLTSDVFIFSPFGDAWRKPNIRNLGTLFSLWRIDPFRTVHQAVASFFNDQRLVQLFDRYATYNGSNPYRAPATLNVIPHVEYTLGGFYPKGGIARLGSSMEALARRLGVTIHLNADVASIVFAGKRAGGIRLADGTEVRADAVISNADAVHTLTSMLGDGGKRFRRYREMEPSSSGLVFLWGVRGNHAGLAHHNIFFSSDYRREFEELFDRRVPPSDPTTYVAITSKADPDHAPEGHENWFVLVNMPSTDPSRPPTDVGRMRERVLAKLRSHGFDISGAIAFERVITPEDFQSRFNANRGSIYGLSSNSRTSAFLRPRNRVRGIGGLYLCGGSAHPGGGIPLVVVSGKLAADACLKDSRMGDPS